MGTSRKPFSRSSYLDQPAGKAAIHFALVVATASLVASCASTPPPAKKRSKEYFSESKYGVKASPRVVEYGQPVPQGGGRYMVGKAYTVKGRVYKPTEKPRGSSVGYASWYGSAFHGRRTANGEVYDMDSLSAAHPTMPLPSYARVTNLKNGSSIVVRVNDRGPYERDRIIDLSSRTAELLDVKHHGSAKVKVEYVGPAKMEGHDMKMLLATYVAPTNTEMGNPSGTMLAMRAPTTRPSTAIAMLSPGKAPAAAPRLEAPSTDPAIVLAMAPIPRARPDVAVDGMAIDPYNYEIQAAQNGVAIPVDAVPTPAMVASAPVELPQVAQPVVTQASAAGTTYGERTLGTFTVSNPVAFSGDGSGEAYPAPVLQRVSANSSYAEGPSRTAAQDAIAALAEASQAPSDGKLQAALDQAVARMAAERSADATIVQIGVYADAGNTTAMAGRLARYGRVAATPTEIDGRTMQSVRLVVTDRSIPDGELIAAVARAGAPGAYILTR